MGKVNEIKVRWLRMNEVGKLNGEEGEWDNGEVAEDK